MNIPQLLKRLKITKKPELQREILLEAWSSCEEFFIALSMSIDSTVVIPVTKFPEIEIDDGFEGEFTFANFQALWDEITQHDANPEEVRIKLLDAAGICEFNMWNNFYRRILLRKLHEDVPMDVVNQVLSEVTGFPIG